MLAPNMHHAIKHVVDICFSPEWNPAHTGRALELAATAQVVTRIGNWTKSGSRNSWSTATSPAGSSRWPWIGGCTPAPTPHRTLAPETVIETILAYTHPTLGLNAVDTLYQLAQERIDAIAAQPLYDAFIKRPVYVQALQQVIKDQAAGKNESR